MMPMHTEVTSTGIDLVFIKNNKEECLHFSNLEKAKIFAKENNLTFAEEVTKEGECRFALYL